METSSKTYLRIFVKFIPWDNIILESKYFDFKIMP